MTRSKFKEVVEKGVVSLSLSLPFFLALLFSPFASDCSSLCVHQVIPAWNISPIKKSSEVYKVRGREVVNPSSLEVCSGDHTLCCPQGPQFVDIPLEEEDSSDEEYRPDEDDEDETAEEVTTIYCFLIL